MLAKQEFLNSPIYRDNLVSPDFKTTALLINLHDDPLYRELLQQRNHLRSKEKDGTISVIDQKELEEVLIHFQVLSFQLLLLHLLPLYHPF